MAEPIASLQNPAVLSAVRLHRRRGRSTSGQTLLEGPVLVGDAVAAGIPIAIMFVLENDQAGHDLASRSGLVPTVVTPAVLERISTTETPQSPVAVIDIPSSRVPPGGRVLVAWELGDPGNCGTLIRTAAAFGWSYLSGPGAADPWSPKVLRAAAGGHFRTALGGVADLAGAREGGRELVAAVVAGGDEPGPLPADAAVLVGSEPHGLPDEIVAAADRRITIPMAVGSESLNASVAGAIILYLGGPGK